LQQFYVLTAVTNDTRATDPEQSVNERVLPREGGNTTVGFEEPSFKLMETYKRDVLKRPLSRPESKLRPVRYLSRQLLQHEGLKVSVVSALRPGALANRVLRCRAVCPSTIPQRTSKGYHDVLFDLLLDLKRSYAALGDVSGMVEKAFSNAFGTRNRKSPGEPREGEDPPRLITSQTSKPLLKSHWEFTHVFGFALRECNVTKGHRQVLQPVAHPIRTTRAGSSYPLPEYPTTMLLRNATGNETSPYCLPDSSMGIDLTPMGLSAARI
jgi:hypothetical protein